MRTKKRERNFKFSNQTFYMSTPWHQARLPLQSQAHLGLDENKILIEIKPSLSGSLSNSKLFARGKLGINKYSFNVGTHLVVHLSPLTIH